MTPAGDLANGRVVYRIGTFLRQCDTTQIIQGRHYRIECKPW